MNSFPVSVLQSSLRRRFLRGLGGLLAVLSLMLLFFGVVLSIVLDARNLEQGINRYLLAEKQRTLKINGPLRLAFWPRLEIDVESLSLSEPQRPEPFVQIAAAHLALQWAPLLARRLVVDAVELQGVSLRLARDADGRLNVDDLLTPTAATPWSYAVAKLHLAQSRLIWDDRLAGRKLVLDDLSLDAGPLASAGAVARGQLEVSGRVQHQPAPQMDARLKLTARYDLLSNPSRQVVQDLQLQLQGQLEKQVRGEAGLEIAALRREGRHTTLDGLQLHVHSAPHRLRLTASQLGYDATDARLQAARVDLDFSSGAAASLPLQAHLTTSLRANWANRATQAVSLEAMAGQLSLNLPRPIKLEWTGLLAVDGQPAQATAVLAGQFDRSPFSTRLHLSRWSPLQLDFMLAIDRLNADDYDNRALRATARHARPSAPTLSWALPQAADVRGEVSIGALQMAGIKARNLHLSATSAAGRLQLRSLP